MADAISRALFKGSNVTIAARIFHLEDYKCGLKLAFENCCGMTPKMWAGKCHMSCKNQQFLHSTRLGRLRVKDKLKGRCG
jgi:hypothetical protein